MLALVCSGCCALLTVHASCVNWLLRISSVSVFVSGWSEGECRTPRKLATVLPSSRRQRQFVERRASRTSSHRCRPPAVRPSSTTADRGVPPSGIDSASTRSPGTRDLHLPKRSSTTSAACSHFSTSGSGRRSSRTCSVKLEFHGSSYPRSILVAFS